MVKKVVALETCGILGIVSNKEYIVAETDVEGYWIINDYNFTRFGCKSRFKPLEEEMEIKVGSEWVDQYGTKVVVKYIGNNILTYQYDNIENSARPEHFLTFHKPAPVRRTVWLNVYEDYAHVCEKKRTS